MKKIGLGVAEGPRAYWNLPGIKSPAQNVTLPPGTVAILLDRSGTTPNAMLAIRTEDSEEPMIMAPGDILPIPEGSITLRVHNAVKDLVYSAIASQQIGNRTSNVGYVRLLALTERDMALYQGGGSPRGALGTASIIGRLAFWNPASMIVPTYGLDGVRLSIVPATTNGRPQGHSYTNDQIPADFAVTVRPYALIPGIRYPVYVGNENHGLPEQPPVIEDSVLDLIMYQEATYMAGGAVDMMNVEAITNTRTVVEWEIKTPGILVVAFTAESGTYDQAIATLEGVAR